MKYLLSRAWVFHGIVCCVALLYGWNIKQQIPPNIELLVLINKINFIAFIKAHGGEIKVETKENEGSEFLIQLPVN